MLPNRLKTKLSNDEPVYGLLTPIYDPAIVELAGHLGFDCYFLDCEHGAGGPIQAEHVVRACETVGMTPLARIRSTDPKLILQFMDAGIMGVMMPGVMDAVKNLDSLLKVEGVDGYFVGPRDLSMSMGFPDGPGHPEVKALITEIFDRVRGAGLITGTVAGSAEEAQDVVQRGGRIILGSVQGLLKLGAGSFLAGRGIGNVKRET